MNGILHRAILLLALLLPAYPGHAAKISWILPSSYADGAPMDPGDVRKIVVRVYAGPARNGPWSLVATSPPGAASVEVGKPAGGKVLWYTATATLNGLESMYAQPALHGRFVDATSPARPVSPVPIRIEEGKAHWELPSSYADGAPMDPGDVRKIVVRVYAGPARNGPWKWVSTSLPGATSIMVMGPSLGRTLWYTAKSTLNGSESGFADPVRKTNLDIPIRPLVKKVTAKMLTVRKMGFLLFLLLLGGSAWLIRSRRRRAGGQAGGTGETGRPPSSSA